MKRVALVVASVILLFFSMSASALSGAQAVVQTPSATRLTLPAGTQVELAVTAPVWARSAKPGDSLFTQTTFPVTSGSHIAIPAGAYIQGRLLAITRPSRKSNRATIQVLFTRIIFANGYVIVLPGSSGDGPAAATAAQLSIQVSPSNDLLLDNGAELEMTLAAPVSIEAAAASNAVAASQPLQPGKLRSASLCRPTPGDPGTPGTADTVIPGSPGTPDTTIPGGPDMPDIVIPGTPATPDTVIPGTPGTPGFPGTSCPAPPLVVASDPLALPPQPTQPLPQSSPN